MKTNPTEFVRRRADGSLDVSFYLAQGRQARSEAWGSGWRVFWAFLGRLAGRSGRPRVS